ncbi:MAG: nucleotidyltransferase domain-containing protein [Candidatus Omnitrophica bacterium]|nr:nucleotidyltransferase domain-containing protein [Candidatus Omnitrophota bacterium]
MNFSPKIDKNVFHKHKVKLAYLFGSRVKGNASEQSDFDIAVLFKKEPCDPLALKEIARLSSDLSKFFPSKVDIVSLHYAPLLLKYEITAHNFLLYCKNEMDRIRFEVSTIKRYIDEAPIRKLYDEALHKKILQGV